MASIDRRTFLRQGAGAVLGAAALAGPFQGFVAAAAAPQGARRWDGLGPLGPVPDERDGVVRLHLPWGFRYRSFSLTGEPMADGGAVPGRHDGMAAFPGRRGGTVLVRNHEVNGPVGAFGDPAAAYDPMAGGGTTTLEVTRTGEVRHVAPSLNGTQMNCAGGPTPWRSWISCEETVNGPDVGNDFTGQDNTLLTKPHGYLFEVPVDRPASHEPIRAAGRFAHEAVAVDPYSGVLYLTEDNFGFPSGFYRYRPPVDPRRARKVVDGGVLEMLAVRDRPNVDLSVGQERGATYLVEWVPIDDPDPTFTGTPTNDEAIQAVGNQGRAAGGALFSRLEGTTAKDGRIYFVSTQGGATAPGEAPPDGFGDGRGQVWALTPHTGRLELVYESPSAATLDLPDNVTAGRWGSLVLCEDGTDDNFLRGLTPGGDLFDIALNRIAGRENEEFAGATFSPRYRTLYVNLQASQAMTFAIRGPWHRGGF
jgi:hypothetical protein